LPEGEEADARNIASSQEKYGAAAPSPWELSWNIWGSASTSPHIYAYDAEASADFSIIEFLQNKTSVDPVTGMSKGLEEKWKNWFLNRGKREVVKGKAKL